MSDSSSERLLAVVDALDALAREQTPIEAAESLAVSYTHLTLPTICSV